MNFARTDEQNNPLYPLDPAETDTAPGVGDEASLKQMLKSLGVNKNEDFLGSKVTYRRAFLSNTKKKEDEGTVAVPKEFPKAKFILDRVASENNIFVSFELASPFDVQGLKIPNRYVIGKYCSWKYQGVALGDPSSGCTYPLNGNYYDIDDNPITTPSAYNNATAYSVGNKVLYDSKIWEAIRPSTGEQPDKSPAYWKRLDVCGKTLSSCKIRFHGTTGMSATQQNNTQIPLPFGGFPGTRKFR
jgi:phage-related protein